MNDRLPDPGTLRMLECLRLNPRRGFAGRQRGERLSKARGVSLEFRDYRDYTEGDDLRHVDWNVLARLRTPIIKTYQDEEDLPVYLAVDSTPSMDFGRPTKLDFACQLGLALGVMALNGGDSVRALRLAQSPQLSRPCRGRRGQSDLTSWLASLRPETTKSFAEHLSSGKIIPRPGLAIVLTDALDENINRMVSILGGAGHEIWLVQILSDEEVEPVIEGDVRLVDSETGAAVEITANSPTVKAYKENLKALNQSVERSVVASGGRYALVRTSDDLRTVVLDILKRNGWIK